MSRTIAVMGGTGAEGFGLALRWARAGEKVVIGSRDATRAEAAAAKIREQASVGNVSGAENAAACAGADVIVLTVPFEGHAALLKQIKTVIAPGTVVVDATVPLAASVGGRATRTLGVWQGSAAQQTAEILGEGISVVGAFQNVSSALLQGDGAVDCDVVVCSDHAEARKLVRELAAKIPGVRPIDGGNLENVRILEQITALLIGLNIRNKVHSGGVRFTGLPEQAYKV
jgi:NADPH-dependent F420 reductase